MNALQETGSNSGHRVLPSPRYRSPWLALLFSLFVHALFLARIDLLVPKIPQKIDPPAFTVEMIPTPPVKSPLPEPASEPPAPAPLPPEAPPLDPAPLPKPAPAPLPEQARSPSPREGDKPPAKSRERPKPKNEERSRSAERAVDAKPENTAPPVTARSAEEPLARPLNLNPSLSDISRWDRERQRRAREHGVKSREATVNLDNPEPRFTTYFTRLKERIEQGWSYPAAAKRDRLSGTLVMRFTIERSGAITNIRIERPSGEAMLDEAALRAVRQLHPFLPLPEDWDLERLHVQSVFEYIRGGFRMDR
ncbi:hypothetical protein SIID45300_01182 [Candidatus Magnetaquicoccaceae bacterium FCR-1]|uniref:TonB C-terminal domain-containing protein n=1 Tax=Candidatus Magnetaquiglobus chichijimensis TaxID=3141448 RepID=A0ABQ0C7K5_9PROT